MTHIGYFWLNMMLDTTTTSVIRVIHDGLRVDIVNHDRWIHEAWDDQFQAHQSCTSKLICCPKFLYPLDMPDSIKYHLLHTYDSTFVSISSIYYADGYLGPTKKVVYIMPIALVPNVGIPPYNWQEEVLVDNAAKLQPLVVTHASGQVTLVAMKAAAKGKSEVNCVLGTVTYWEPAGTLYCEIKLDVSYPPALETPELGDAP